MMTFVTIDASVIVFGCAHCRLREVSMKSITASKNNLKERLRFGLGHQPLGLNSSTNAKHKPLILLFHINADPGNSGLKPSFKPPFSLSSSTSTENPVTSL